jgi:FkbM family methyltransferase
MPSLWKRIKTFVRLRLADVLPDSLVIALTARYEARRLARVGTADEPDLDVVLALLGPGDCAVDVGANFGRYTVAMAARVGPDGAVLSVEPVPRTVRLLQAILARMDLSQVRSYAVALSDASGTASMEVPRRESGEVNYFRARIGGQEGGETVQVALRTLDDLLSETGCRPAFVKVDVEGHEPSVLRGARGLLAQREAAWLIELNDDIGDAATPSAQVLALMQDADYEARWFDGTALRLPPAAGVNYFFLNQRHFARLREAGFAVE